MTTPSINTRMLLANDGRCEQCLLYTNDVCWYMVKGQTIGCFAQRKYKWGIERSWIVPAYDDVCFKK